MMRIMDTDIVPLLTFPNPVTLTALRALKHRRRTNIGDFSIQSNEY